MIPATLAPTLKGLEGPVVPTICRLSRDLARLAFWAPKAAPPGLFVGNSEQGDDIGSSAKRVFSPADREHLSDLAWSADGQYLAFTLSSGPPPGELCVGVLHLATGRLTRLAGHAFAWAGTGPSLLIADPAGSRLYLKDLDLDVELRIGEIANDGDPHFQPIISVSPDYRRFALVTRRVLDNATHVHMAQHDGRAWQVSPLSEMPGASIRILPFWSIDSRAFALYVIDLEQHHSAIIGVPPNEGEGEILYTSDTVDAFITPAPHPDGRLIAMVRAHPMQAASTLVENRLVLVDPAERSVAPITPDNTILGALRWLDAQTLLVEGGPAVWTVKLRATEEPAEDPGPASPAEGYVRTIVRDIEPAFTFACEIPAGWQRVPLPPEPVDFADPRVMRPLCLFTPSYAAIVFTVATRPLIPGSTPATALAYLSDAQQLAIEPVRAVTLPCGRGAETTAAQTAGGETMKMRLIMFEDGGHLFSLTVMAPGPLWDAMKPTLDHIVQSFVLVDPRGPTTPAFE
ncbi:MAG: hypothetical protein JWN40_5631 [Phycisphaerales bacterium]|nr:hypothetical protein [Phycisphaerales bacterium]